MFAQKLETAERLVQSATEALLRVGAILPSEVDGAATAIYATDAAGVLTYFNAACIGLAGRKPAAGQDRWCVTWKLYTEDGEVLPHDRCPMAVAIRERRRVRGLAAIAERPDGTRRGLLACPTPLVDASSAFVGAVNALVELSFADLAAFHQGQAQRCRRLAMAVNDTVTIETMLRLGRDFETKAQRYRALDA
jgi:PAS domain-containing protein